MDEDIFRDILDEERRKILPLLADFKAGFYLAGGTGLALQLGHRDSIDFDFFRPDSFSTEELFEKVQATFTGHKIEKIQDEKDTLSVIIDDKIRFSFLTYPYPLIGQIINDRYLRLASVADIGCMKFSAMTGRAALKDYIDLYFILHKIPLRELVQLSEKKFPTLNHALIMKSLVYFDDIEFVEINYKHGRQVDFSDIKKYLEDTVKNHLKAEYK
ncbi:MAG: nucleotidyl transferase AbiEii/AbiGii toxin family protein [Patescibacteria group bacterium]